MIKLLVFDMDDTLLDRNKKIMPKTKEKLIELQKQGVRVCLASGRPKARLMDYVEELEMDKHDGIVIEANGASYYDFKTACFTELRMMTLEECKEVYAYLRPLFPEVEHMFYAPVNAYIITKLGTKDSIFYTEEYPERSAHRKIIYMNDPSEIKEEIAKISICADPIYIPKVKEAMLSFKPEKYWSGIVHDFWLEITPSEVSKGNCLQKILEENGIKEDEVLIFGDGENDISMADKGISISMVNAIDSFKKVCKYSTRYDNNHEGIYQFLEEELWNL